jgi:diguanylate cyclase (GGDEF)-like protein/PAS domain S-box-containing protein
MTDLGNINLKKLLDNAKIGVVIHNTDTSVVYANPAALQLLNLSYEQIIGKDAMDPQWHFIDEHGRILPTEDYPISRVLQRKEVLNQEVLGVVFQEDKDINWFLVDAYLEGFGKNGFVVVTFTDITDKKTQFSFRDVVENAQDIIIITEVSPLTSPLGPKIVYVNKAFETLTGYSETEVIGETPRILQGNFTDADSLKRISMALKAQLPVRETLLNYGKNGRPYWLDINIIPLKNKLGKVTHFAAIERDVTEQKFHAEQLEKSNKDLKILKDNLLTMVEKQTAELKNTNFKLQRLAYYDFLTGLPNRRSFMDNVQKQLSLAKRNGSLLMMGVIDLDDFKAINDQFGHDIGDHVIKLAAESIRSVFRLEDCFGRLGGEEFSFSLVVENTSNAELVCQRLLNSIAAQKHPISEQEFASVTASIGITVLKPSKNTTVSDLYSQADQALYDAKAQHKNCFRQYNQA